jgi:sugar phosphate isomerase/epimerase
VKESKSNAPVFADTANSLKGKFPFSLGCTSYVLPDNILPNVEAMGPLVDDIELVLFESNDLSNLPDQQTIERLGELAAEHNISYTIHFPIDKKAGATDPSERSLFAERCSYIARLTAPLRPHAYILHLEGITFGAGAGELGIWKGRVVEAIEQIVENGHIARPLLAVENLGYPIGWHLDIVEQHGLSLCLDIGHLWLYNQDWRSLPGNSFLKARVIHLHGVSNGKDHLSLKKSDAVVISEFLSEALAGFRGVLTLELFSENDTFESMEIVREAWEKSL